MARDHRPSKHHILARARNGGNRRNIVVLPQDFHEALHTVIGLLDRDEAQTFLAFILTPGTVWNWHDIEQLRERIMRQRMAS